MPPGSVMAVVIVEETSRMLQPVEILLIDSQEVLSDALWQFLRSSDDLAVLGVTRNGDSGVRVLQGEGPETLILDIEGTEVDSVADVATAKAFASDSRVLALSSVTHGDAILHAGTCNGGVRVLAGSSSEQVVDTIRELLKSHDVLVSYTPSMPEFRRDPGVELLASRLSPRELDILELVTAGYSNKRIAETYFLSLHTVRTHIQSILIKLGVHSKLEAAIFAVQQRLVSLGGQSAGPLPPQAQVETG
jgi:DNA-binding NarL/FixJ family response regulator